MRKAWHFLWILWLLLAVANLLLINVYGNHITSGGALSLYQQLGYLGMTLIFLLLSGLWWIFVGNSIDRKGLTVFGAIVTAIMGAAIVGSVVYTLAFGGKYITVAVNKLAEWFSFLNF